MIRPEKSRAVVVVVVVRGGGEVCDPPRDRWETMTNKLISKVEAINSPATTTVHFNPRL